MPNRRLTDQAPSHFAVSDGRPLLPYDRHLTLHELIRRHGPAIFLHRRDCQAALRRLAHLPPTLLDAPLQNGMGKTLRAYQRSAIGHGLSPSTVNNECALVRVALRFAFERALIGDYRQDFPTELPVPDRRWRLLTPEESRVLRSALVAHAEAAFKKHKTTNARRVAGGVPQLPVSQGVPFSDALAPIVLLIWESGLRDDEWPLLRWCDIDLKYGTVTAGQRRRSVPLTAAAKDLLLMWRSQRDASDMVFAPARPEKIPAQHDRDLSRKMATRHAIAIRRGLARLVAEAGLHDIHLSDLRRDFGMQLLRANVPIATIAFFISRASVMPIGMESRTAAMANGIRALEASRSQERSLMQPVARNSASRQ